MGGEGREREGEVRGREGRRIGMGRYVRIERGKRGLEEFKEERKRIEQSAKDWGRG